MTTLRFFRIRRTNRARAPAAVTSVPASIALSFTARLSGIADARIDVGVHDVHHEIDQHVGGGREQHDPLYDRIIPPEDRGDDEPPEPGDVEDDLGDTAPPMRIAVVMPITVT